jgi:hypothetical protein
LSGADNKGQDRPGRRRVATPAQVETDPAGKSRRSKIGEEEGAKVHNHYKLRHEEYVPVTRDDLREIQMYGWMHQLLFGVGSFLFSGAFWLLIELLIKEKFSDIVPWVLACGACIAAGGALSGVGLVLFFMKQKRLEKYFHDDPIPQS